MKIQFFALFLAAQLSLLPLDRAVAMDNIVEQPGDSLSGARSVDSISIRQPTVPPSFSANYRLQHQPSSTLLDEARILYSEAGMRVEQQIAQSTNVYIANHAEGKFWFVDRKRRLVHSIPVIESQHEVPFSADSGQPSTSGFIQLSPCSGLTGKPGATELFQGRSVQHWTCMSQGEVVEEQWYASNPGIVVRSRTSDGFLSELTDLRYREFSSSNFQPPSHYRKVSIEELINPVVPIGSYVE